MLQLYQLCKSWQLNTSMDRESLEDDFLPQPPPKKTLTMFTMDDIRVTVTQIANAIGISRERVENTLHNENSTSKVSVRYVLRLLTPDQKHTRLVMWQANLTFLKQILQFFSPKMSVGSTTSSQRPNDIPFSRNTFLLPLQRRPMCCNRQESNLASVFWDAKGILFINYLKKGQTINITIPFPHFRRYLFLITGRPLSWGKLKDFFSRLFHIISISPPPFLGNFSQLTPYLGNIMVTPIPFLLLSFLFFGLGKYFITTIEGAYHRFIM